MKTRVITAIVMVAAMVPFFIFSNTAAFPVLIAFLSAVAIIEMQGCIGSKKFYPVSLPTVIAAALMPFGARYISGDKFLSYVFIASFSVITYTFIASVFSRKSYPVDIAALSSATAVYISFGLTSIVLLRDVSYGQFIVYLPFIIPWSTDTFAYFCGRAFGKHKLIPDVSPKKTVEGSVGGTLCAVLLTMLYGFVIGKSFSVTPNYLGLAVVALVVSLLSQCGDLIMSLVKRKFEIKDYSKLFPGHGGVLDRFDSIIATAPYIYFLTEFLPVLKLFS